MLTVSSIGFELETVVTGLNQPVTFDAAPDGRLFVAEKEGTVAIFENGQRVATFLDIRDRVNSFQDRGLLSLALDPDFENNGYVYLNYAKEIDDFNPEITPGVDPADLDAGSRDVTPTNPLGQNALGEVLRVTVSASDPNTADLSTQVVVHDGFFHAGGSHSVGDIDFDNDGNLIFTWGDGGFDVQARLAAQDPDDPRGKVYRINKETFEGVPNNPFYELSDPGSQRSKVWAVGVRNSWKLTVDEPTGDVYISEVTDSGPEEINVLRADGSTTPNFGWPWFTADNPSNRGPEYDPANNLPVNFEYESPFVALTKTESYFAIVGGAVYRPDATPADNYPSEFDGLYFFSEIGTGDLFVTDQQGEPTRFGNLGGNEGIVDIQLGPDGTLWAMSLFTGKIQRVVFTGEGDGIDQRVLAEARASRTAGEGPLTVQFDGTGSRVPQGATASYAWDFDGNGSIDSTDARPVHTYSTTGRHVARLSVTDGFDTSEQVVEIDVLASTPVDTNLALGKPTLQSSTRNGQVADGGAASRAVDGNTSGVFSNNSVTHTATERSPFWEVDLETVGDLSSIRLFNRANLGGRLSDFYVMVSEEPITSGNPNAAVALPGVKFALFPGAAGSSATFDLSDFVERVPDGSTIAPTDLRGRYVRVQLTAQQGILSLAEVQVFGTADPVARFFDLEPPRLIRPGQGYPVQVDAYDSGGAIDNVRLFVNDVFVRQESFSPYEWTSDAPLQNLPRGEHTLRAVATDASGAEVTIERTIAVGIEGDYNRDGVVNTADYAVWRDRLGQQVDPFTSADGDGNGIVDAGDRQVWIDHVGLTDADIPDDPVPVHAANFAGVQITGTEAGDSFDDLVVTFQPHSGGAAVTVFAEDFTGVDGARLDEPALDNGWAAVSGGGIGIATFGSVHARGAGVSRNSDAFDTTPLIEEGAFTVELLSRVRGQFAQNVALVDASGATLFAVGNLDTTAGSGFEATVAGGPIVTLGDTPTNPVSDASHVYYDLRITYDTQTRSGTVEVGPGALGSTPDGPYESLGVFSPFAGVASLVADEEPAAAALPLALPLVAPVTFTRRATPGLATPVAAVDQERLDLLSAAFASVTRPAEEEPESLLPEATPDERDDAFADLAVLEDLA